MDNEQPNVQYPAAAEPGQPGDAMQAAAVPENAPQVQEQVEPHAPQEQGELEVNYFVCFVLFRVCFTAIMLQYLALAKPLGYA